MKYGGKPVDLNSKNYGSECKVTHADGSVTYEPAMYWGYWQDHQKRGRKARKAAR